MKKHMLFVIFLLFGYFCFGQTAVAPSAGNGSAEDPWQIASLENLYWIAEDSSRWEYSYLQTAEINASPTETWFGGKGWLPIGNGVTEFSGSYDGNDYVIDSLYINRSGEKNIGLFGLTEQAFLRNIGLDNARMTGRINVGCLVGLALNGSTIERCYSHGEVNVQDTCGGGMFGGLKQSEVNESYSGGTVTGTEDAWGVGGFSGATWMNETWIGDCYSTCSVGGTVYVGGFVGINEGNVYHCYSNGAVSGSGEYIGGLIGYTNNATVEDVITACFWDTQRSGLASSSGGTGLSIAEMQTLSTFTDAGWDFSDIWGMDSLVNDGFPYLPWKAKESDPLAIAPEAGDGSAENPYRIASLENLFWIAADSGRWVYHYIQTADIDATPTQTWFGGKGWIPVVFNGFYNGQGYVIDHLNINRVDSDNVGLFATAGDVINLQLTNVNITGRSSVGSLAGYCGSFGRIDNCHSSGIVNGLGGVGGLIGWSQQSMIMNCSFDGAVNGRVEAGGLVGANGMGSIQYSYSTASVSGVEYTGGLTGRNWGSIVNCYSTGNVSGSAYVGGLSGAAVGSGYSPATIDRCYCSGHVSGDSLTGGLTGDFSLEFTTISNSFWDVEATGQLTSAGEGTGGTTAEMKTQTTFTDAGWAFPDLWGMNTAVNSGYPHLLWQIAPEPAMETLDIVNIRTDSAEVRYRIGYLGLPFPVHGICVSDSANPTVDGRRTLDGPADSTGDFISLLYPLESNTQYYVRAYATNTIGTFYGNILSFTTFENALPVISGLTVTNIDTTTATAHAEINTLGYPYPYQHGFCWSPAGSPTLENEKVELGNIDSTGVFSAEIRGLLPGTRYYVRAYATNAQGTAYGDTLSFSTLQTGIGDGIPQEFALAQNYPNPFNPITTIGFAVPELQHVKLQIFDISGHLIKTLVDEFKEAGYWNVKWNAGNYSSGIYIYRLQYGDRHISRKMLLLK